MNSTSSRRPIFLLIATVLALVISGVHPYDPFTWWLEVSPVFIGLAILLPTYQSFRLTSLLYTLLFVHGLILMLGGHYTYERVPLGEWMQEAFGFARNPYDRIGHLAQGFIPAILAREILIRKNVVRGRGWLFFLVTSICLAFSALYELLEWTSAMIAGGAADAFLGTQGDIWDSQWDMLLALVGAVLSQAVLARYHDKLLADHGHNPHP